MTTTTEAVRQVLAADSAEELFGTVDPARRFRDLARALHPDLAGPGTTAVFVRLTELWRDRAGALLRTPAGGAYRLSAPRYVGDVADLYDAGDGALLKLPRRPADNDLMEREARALRLLAERGDPRYLPYVPRLVETFRHRDPATDALRRVTVVGSVPNLHSLAEVRAGHPDGLDPRDVAWMWRRLLVALGFAHRAGVVHGAVLPPHVLIEPEGHGVVLVDWCYSTCRDDADDTVPALVPEYRAWYPVEVTGRRPPGPATDIAMASRCMTYLMGDRAPGPLRAFAAGCALPAPASRPDDAWRLLGELDGVLSRLYGPRRFRPLRLRPS